MISSVTLIKSGLIITATSVLCFYCYKFIRNKLSTFNDPFKEKTIKIISSDTEDNENVYNTLRTDLNKFSVLGFDCEWITVKGNRKPIALLQLASCSKLCVLIRLHKLELIPNYIKEILANPDILKVGIIPHQDATFLKNDYGLLVESCFDLQNIANSKHGLSKLTEEILGKKLDKHWRIRCSNWEAEELTNRQIEYAALDALSAIEIFKKLTNNKKFNIEEYKYLLNKPFYSKGGGDNKIKSIKKLKKIEQKKAAKLPTRKSPLYDNCLMKAPDGDMLCTCDKSKAQWYLDKELADLISNDPMTIQLRFEPAGRAVGAPGQYYTSIKHNRCVVCGRTDSYVRKNVVPREYRHLFPPVLKDRASHDILLLCVTCHRRSDSHDLALREQLAVLCNAPFNSSSSHVDSDDLKQLKSAARALLRFADKIPEKRREELEKIVLKHFPGEEAVNESILLEAEDVTYSFKNENYVSHGQRVVDYFVQQAQKTDIESELGSGGLMELEKLWREHFLKTMKPRYMPELWSVSHNKHRLEIHASEGRLDPDELRIVGCKINTDSHHIM